MELLLLRKHFNDECTIGSMSSEGFFCYTLEDIVRPIGVKIDGETAIPEGRYKVVITMSNRFKREMPLLLDVPGFAGVRIHTGNTAKDTHGCILVGKEQYSDTSIGNCAAVYNELYNKIKAELDEGKEVWLTIKNE